MTGGWVAGPPPLRDSGGTAVAGLPTSVAVPVSPWSRTRVAEPRHVRQLTHRRRIAELLLVAAAFGAAAGVVALTGATGALFSDSAQKATNVGAGHIFPGTRSTSAFVVSDASGGGAPVDRSSPFAAAGDGLTQSTGSWPTTFSPSRYVQFDMNAPLPSGLGASSTFNLRFGSSSPVATLCVYLDVRSTSTGTVLGTYGSSGSPLACASGAMATVAQPLGVLTSTDTANDLSVRVYGSDTASSPGSFDLATVSGTTTYASFTLYPASFTDSADGTAATVTWALEGP